MAKINNHLVIMAGGVGSRFWPMSTAEKPKQFIDVLGIGTLCLVENEWQKKAEELQEKLKEQESPIHTLEASNKYMEEEMKRVKASRDEMSKKCSEALADNKRMHNQSLWERIFER